ncbi:hypothetical protein ACJMK2_039510 [Sinanodonta woodiana]|uniref:C-type lectin domain-containing protein n=1 Tax=Sinanodonta woodiana TaxID=1069815 RepID=A0ABD3WD49_SINWO
MRATPPVGLWQNSACNVQQQYVCQFRRQGYTLPPFMPSTSVGHCPNSWTPYRGFCFFAFGDISQRKTWFEARDFCRSLHGDLPSLHSTQDDVFLSQTLLRAYSQKYFWLGLNDIDNEAGYIWSDRTPTDYTNWNQGEPNNANDQEDCTEYSMYTKTWNDNSCYLARYFICQIRPAKLCGSDPSWLYYNDTCYRLNDVSGPNATFSWYNAEAYCNNFLSHLVSIHSSSENQFLLALISKRSQTKYWTGLNELDLNSYKWTDLSIVNYNNWEASEPNDYFGGEKCAEMHNWNGMWNDANCNQKLGYICKKPVHGRATFIPTIYPPGGCSNGFVRLPGGQNKCYYLGGLTTDTKSNWTDARDKCRGFGKYYDIASIESDFEQAFLVSLMRGYTFRFWIGLSDLNHNGQFVWLDNEPMTYTNWDKGQPTNTQGQAYCVAMRTLDPVGKWANFQCATQLAYICQTKQDPSIPTISPPSSCSAGYASMVNSQNCYKLYSNAKKTWKDAQVVCKADGGNLASILNVNEAAFIQVLAYNMAPYWIGLSDASTSGVSTGVYSWSDGWTIMYSSWGRNQPDHGANEGCVVVDNSGKWNDTTCNSVYNYVCKISSVSPPLATSPVLGQCADPTWIMNGGFCYFMDVNAKMSWPEANYRCNRIGMGLLSIHSKTENMFVLSLIQQATVQDPNYQPNIWTGLSKGPSGAFVYSDQTPVDYLNWEQGAPSGVGQKNQMEECIEVNRFSGQWNDLDCFVRLGYMCKVAVVSSTTAIPLPPGSSDARQQITYTPYIIPPTRSQINTTGSGSVGYTIRYPNGSVVNRTYSQTPSAQYLNQESDESPSLSGGGIAGIIIGVIAILLIIAIGMLLLKRRIGPGAFSRSGIRENSENLSFDNALYSKYDETVNIDTPEKKDTSPKLQYASPSEEASDA